MTKNMGPFDRTARLSAAAIIALLYFTGRVTGILAVVLGVLAVIFVLTSVVGWCPLYTPFKLSTRKAQPS